MVGHVLDQCTVYCQQRNEAMPQACVYFVLGLDRTLWLQPKEEGMPTQHVYVDHNAAMVLGENTCKEYDLVWKTRDWNTPRVLVVFGKSEESSRSIVTPRRSLQLPAAVTPDSPCHSDSSSIAKGSLVGRGDDVELEEMPMVWPKSTKEWNETWMESLVPRANSS